MSLFPQYVVYLYTKTSIGMFLTAMFEVTGGKKVTYMTLALESPVKSSLWPVS